MKETQRKLILLPVDLSKRMLIEESIPSVRINFIPGQMYAAKKALEEMNMDGQFYKLFFDQANSVIAWRIKNELGQNEIEEKTWRLAKKNTNGLVSVSVGRILKALNQPTEGSKRFEIQKWNAKKDSLLEDGEYYYIDLTKPIENEKV